MSQYTAYIVEADYRGIKISCQTTLKGLVAALMVWQDKKLVAYIARTLLEYDNYCCNPIDGGYITVRRIQTKD